MTGTQPFRMGFIGCGGYGHTLADAAARSEAASIAACFDTSSEAAEAFAGKYGATSHPDLPSLVTDPAVDGVVIATPNSAHCSAAKAAFAAGKHVFIEKPIANTLEDALDIIVGAARAGVTLAVGHNGRRHAGHRAMKQMIEEGRIGTPVTVEANFSHAGGLGLAPGMWRYDPAECPGLPLMQLGVHFADTAAYLVGDVREVASFMSHIATPANNNDVTVSLLRFDNGLLGYLGSNYASPSVYYVNVYGTDGNLCCQGGSSLVYAPTGSTSQDIALVAVDTQREEIEEFAMCARQGKRCEVAGEEALKALAVVRAAIMSHEDGRPVAISDVLAHAREALGLDV